MKNGCKNHREIQYILKGKIVHVVEKPCIFYRCRETMYFLQIVGKPCSYHRNLPTICKYYRVCIPTTCTIFPFEEYGVSLFFIDIANKTCEPFVNPFKHLQCVLHTIIFLNGTICS